MDLFNLQTSLTDTSLHILSVVHLRIAIGYGRKIKACHGQTESRWFEALTIPQRFHDVDASVLGHRLFGTLQDSHDLLHRETVEELTHPNGVQSPFTFGEECLRIEQVNAIATDALCAWLILDILLHHANLLGQVEYGDFYLVVVTNALQGPFARIAANVVERLDMVLVEDDFQGLREG